VRVVSGLYFFPRGGSSHVARALAGALPDDGWDVEVLSGSLAGGPGDARAFYAGLDVHAVDFDAGDAPMQGSFEDRPGAPDRCFARIDDEEYERHVAAWCGALQAIDAAGAAVLHLHHLTPLNEAARRVAPGVPVVGHLHGTELLLLERIAAGPPTDWPHAQAWAARMRRWAQRCARILLLSDSQIARATELLGVERSACVVVPNGFEPDAFRPAPVDRRAFWREQLVDHPRGWAPGAEPGSVAYSDEDVAALDGAVVVLAVGRYTEVKRLPLLIRAFADAQRRARRRACLVVVGGHPGEWEGEHPLEAIERSGARDVFLAGWHDHHELPAFLNAGDLQVLASVREQFGLVLVEGMACGLPAIAVDRFGPADIVTPGETGWLVEPDDRRALADAIVLAVDDGEERARRGIVARRTARATWSWPALARRVSAVLEEAAGVGGGDRTPAGRGR
jgi:glycosyltransferase involved in cell wall biosynthesis